MNISERIKEIRKKLGLKQSEFGEAIGVKEATITSWETGTRKPSDTAITAICSKFGINEEWLRDGVGDMETKFTRDEEIAKYIGSVLKSDSKDFQRRFLRALSKLSESEWEMIQHFAEEFIKKD